MAKPEKLDFNESHKTTYAVPMWLRDEQIRINTATVKGRIGDPVPVHEGKIAVVCYGPSLNDTWQKIKDFNYVITGSGSHKFLLQRGIVPNWHVEVDPREHKVKLLGEPSDGTEYLIASTCHPKLFERLKNYRLKLWHIFDSEEEGLRVLPRGEWALTGGANVGLRQMCIARYFGFRELHVFGMDGCEGKTGKHAASHPAQAKGASVTTYDGVDYRVTPAFLECAKRTFAELDQLHDVNATFYGEGLVQHMSRNYVRKPVENTILALHKPEVISASYRDLNIKLHSDNLAYGVGGGKHAERVLAMVAALQKDQGKFPSVLDYGCGKGFLAKSLQFPIWEYDPAIPGKQDSPRPADLVICTDVLEHVEPDCIDIVLDDLRRCMKLVGFFAVHTGPAKKTLADGRNAHLIQEDQAWWTVKLQKYFNIAKTVVAGPERYFVVSPRAGKVTVHVAAS
jgi:uncharacterized Rossmann fold enzyme